MQRDKKSKWLRGTLSVKGSTAQLQEPPWTCELLAKALPRETRSYEPLGGEGTIQAGHFIFSAEATFQHGDENRHHKEEQRARTTPLEIEPLTTTQTTTQQPKSRQLYCFTKLVLLLFHIYISVLFCWTHEIKVQSHIYFHWLLSEGLGSLGKWACDICTAAAQLLGPKIAR